MDLTYLHSFIGCTNECVQSRSFIRFQQVGDVSSPYRSSDDLHPCSFTGLANVCVSAPEPEAEPASVDGEKK